MSSPSLILRLQRTLRDIAADRSGNVMITFALALVPIVGVVGAAFDYTRAAAVYSALQSAVDATALAVSKTAANESATQLQTDATNLINASFKRPEAGATSVSATYDSSSSSVTVSASTSLNFKMISLLKINNTPISASSTVKWGNSRLRVALALDNTGSMADYGKIVALKSAAKNLLNQLKAAATNNGDVYVSVIPFNTSVNVGGPGNYNASWVDFSLWDANNGSCSSSGGGFGWGLGVGSSTQSTCNGTWTPANHNTWNGCVTDRNQSYDTQNTAPSSGNTSTLFPAEPDGTKACPVELIGQTYNWTQLSSTIDAMTPNGATNQAIGLAWAWQSLTTGNPLNAPATSANYQYQQIIILLTDGLNTQDRWYGNGYNTAPQVDARQTITCNNIKAAGITLYTVQVNTDGDPTSTLLQSCASDPSKFFLLTTANQIVTTFATIGTQLSQLRISK